MTTCPRCRTAGWHHECDRHGGYMTCLFCGHVEEDGEPMAYNAQLDRAEAIGRRGRSKVAPEVRERHRLAVRAAWERKRRAAAVKA